MNWEWWVIQICVFTSGFAVGWYVTDLWRWYKRRKKFADTNFVIKISADTSEMTAALADVETQLKRIIRLQYKLHVAGSGGPKSPINGDPKP